MPIESKRFGFNGGTGYWSEDKGQVSLKLSNHEDASVLFIKQEYKLQKRHLKIRHY